MPKILKTKILIISLMVFFMFSNELFGAEVFFESENNKFTIGEDFLVNFYLDAEGESVNAVSGKIVFDQNILEVKEIRDGNSPINFWIQKPIEDQEGVVFSGITPGGLSLDKNLVFGIVFSPKKSGNGTINLEEIEILKNDGNGNRAQVKITPLNFSVRDGAGLSNFPKIIDEEPPEDFRPDIGKDPEIFGGQYFLVFVTQDKGSGIDHYEIREGFWGKYERAESPYLIKDQSLNKKIYVKAVDKALNERVVSFRSGKLWYQQYFILGIILVAIIIAAFVSKNKWKRIFIN